MSLFLFVSFRLHALFYSGVIFQLLPVCSSTFFLILLQRALALVVSLSPWQKHFENKCLSRKFSTSPCNFYICHNFWALVRLSWFCSMRQTYCDTKQERKSTLAGVCIQIAALKRTWSHSCLRSGAPWGKPSRYFAKDRNCSSTALVIWTRDDWGKQKRRKLKDWTVT